MKKVDELYAEAFHLHVGEGESSEAVEVCRRALETDPNHYPTRMLLGIILGDSESESDRREARYHFVEAIRRAEPISQLFDPLDDYAALYHLGISEMQEGHDYEAAMFFLLSFLICGGERVVSNEESHRYLFELLDKINSTFSAEVRMIVDRVTANHRWVPLSTNEAKQTGTP
jgi:tetratricopeptide (TPR) repeat protein